MQCVPKPDSISHQSLPSESGSGPVRPRPADQPASCRPRPRLARPAGPAGLSSFGRSKQTNNHLQQKRLKPAFPAVIRPSRPSAIHRRQPRHFQLQTPLNCSTALLAQSKFPSQTKNSTDIEDSGNRLFQESLSQAVWKLNSAIPPVNLTNSEVVLRHVSARRCEGSHHARQHAMEGLKGAFARRQ